MFTLAAYLHDLDPFALRFTDTIGLRWYGLSYVAAFLLGYLILRHLGTRRLCLIPPQHALDAMMIIILGTVVGGRLGYCLVYDRALLAAFSADFPFWGALAIHRGGMASHGGLIGLCAAAWWVSRGFKSDSGARVGQSSTLHVMDCLAVMAPPGLFLGRLANFINGELLGAILAPPGTPGPRWSVMFPQELRGWIAPGLRDPASHTPDLSGDQRRVLWDLVIDALAAAGQTRQQAEALLLQSGQAAADAWHRGLDLLIAHPSRHRDGLIQILSSRHPSQIYQALAEGLILGVALWIIWARPRFPGVIAAWFFILYGVLRILTEVWRLPDAQFAVGRPLGLSRGQWLSAGMVLAGFALLALATRLGRRTGQRLGGWRSTPPAVTPSP